MNARALVWAVALCIVVAVIEIAIGAEGDGTWYASLRRPAWRLPTAGIAGVTLPVCVIHGFIAYRLLTASVRSGDRGLGALAVVMPFNALCNHLLFETRDPPGRAAGADRIPGAAGDSAGDARRP